MARCACAQHSVCGVGWTQFTTLHGLSSHHDSNIAALVFVWSCSSRTLSTYVPSWSTAHNTHPGPAHTSHLTLPWPRTHRLPPPPSCNTGMLSPST